MDFYTFVTKESCKKFFLLLLFSLSFFQIYRSYKFIKHSPKQNQDIQKLLAVFPQKHYKRVYEDAHSLIQNIPEIQSEQQKVFSYPCSFLDKYPFTYTFGVRVYPAQENSKGFLVTCKEDKEVFEELSKRKTLLLKDSEFFYLWKLE